MTKEVGKNNKNHNNKVEYIESKHKKQKEKANFIHKQLIFWFVRNLKHLTQSKKWEGNKSSQNFIARLLNIAPIENNKVI